MSWRQDESNTLTVEGATVTLAGDPAGGQSNAIWSTGGTGYWDFKVGGPPGTWVGVSNEDKFSAGYKIKGLFYGGNLSDGSGLVTSQWGPKFGNNDVIGMRVEQSEDTTTVAYSKNGIPLGIAFEISGWRGAELRPAVSMTEAGQSVTITAGSLPPIDSMAKLNSPREDVEGAWVGRFKLNIKKTREGSWRFIAKASNCMNLSVTEKDGTLMVGQMMSTLMLPSPELQELEQEVSSLLRGLTSFKREGDDLVLEGAGAREVLSPDQGPGPAGRDNIHWMNE